MKVTRKSALISTLLLAFATTCLSAQEQTPGDAPNPSNRAEHRVTFLTKLLNLTPAQQQQATTIFANAASGAHALRDTLRTAHQGLKDAVKANNASAIDQNAAAIGNATSQLISTRAKARAAFYQILTPDQQSKLGEFESQHHGWYGRRFHRWQQ